MIPCSLTSLPELSPQEILTLGNTEIEKIYLHRVTMCCLHVSEKYRI